MSLSLALTRALVRRLPDEAAARLAMSAAGRTQRPPVREPEQAALEAAVELRWGPRHRHVAWSWGHEGPLVMLVHGWNGRAAQMAPLAHSLASGGFRVVAMDATGHGRSPGSRASWAGFIREIGDFAATLTPPLHAVVGHSAGGLSLMAARRAGRLAAAHYVCIAAPSHPFPPVEALRQRLGLTPPVLERCRQALAAQLGLDWPALAACGAWQGAGRDLLLVYDEGDRFIPHTEADRIRAACPGATVVKTRGHGHSRILAAPELATAVLRFIGAPVTARTLRAA